MTQNPLEKTDSDIHYEKAKLAISMVPGVGSTAAELIEFFVGSPLSRRRDQVIMNLMNDVAELQRLHNERADEFVGSDFFVTTVQLIVQASMRTHKEEKLAYFRNALKSTALHTEYDEDISQVFINNLDEVTLTHIKLLMYFQDPQGYMTKNGYDTSKYYMGGVFQPVYEYVLTGYGAEFVKLIATDLFNKGFLLETNTGTMTATGMFQKRTTPFGDSFLKFIGAL